MNMRYLLLCEQCIINHIPKSQTIYVGMRVSNAVGKGAVGYPVVSPGVCEGCNLPETARYSLAYNVQEESAHA